VNNESAIVGRMSLLPPPNCSKGQIKKAGDILISEIPVLKDRQEAIEIAGQWRASHAYPMNTFQATLRIRLRKGGYRDYIVAQRLKRMPTIIDKLKRFPNMNLTTMGDIGGLRAILPKLSDVKKLADQYKKSRFSHTQIALHDYITDPKPKTGYRGIHFIYSYKNTKHPRWDGLRLELQIRTYLQHLWATAVETMGTVIGESLKSEQGSDKWLDFFALVSSAFAYEEKAVPIPRFAHLSEKQTFKEIASAEKKLGVIKHLTKIALATTAIKPSISKKWHYHLIILKTPVPPKTTSSVEVKSYGEGEISLATKDYQEIEERAANEQIEAVLVSAGRLVSLVRAYPNYFLDTNEFIAKLKKIIESAK
jgi:hypothetical protein